MVTRNLQEATSANTTNINIKTISLSVIHRSSVILFAFAAAAAAAAAYARF